ncbi:MAG: hypothetical protein LAT83_05020 [Kiritimatiellae bacterium]|nr:hypothetical protein [Kiritimatiellia bacterium]
MKRKNETFLAKAKEAYFTDDGVGVILQPSNVEEVIEDGNHYVVFENVNGVLAVYRESENGESELTDYVPVAYRGDEDFKTKAERLYFEEPEEGGSVCQPGQITQVEEDGQLYVVFENVKGVLAVITPDEEGEPEYTDYIPVPYRDADEE